MVDFGLIECFKPRSPKNCLFYENINPEFSENSIVAEHELQVNLFVTDNQRQQYNYVIHCTK